MKKSKIYRGAIYFAEVPATKGSEQCGVRPCIVLQNDIGNIHSPTIIVALITGKPKKMYLPTHVSFKGYQTKLHPDSIIMLEQIKTVDCCRLRTYVEQVDTNMMKVIDKALAISIGLS